ncbi:MAG: hypothetical protein Roseis2KO_06950 [Roseivirga sp.]
MALSLAQVLSQSAAAEVPVKVKENFSKKFPTAKLVEWKLDDEVYVVTFTVDEVVKESVFEKSGKWTETKSILTVKILSEETMKEIAKKLPQSTLEDVTFIEQPGKKTYEVGVVTKEDSYVIVVLNDKGKILEVN